MVSWPLHRPIRAQLHKQCKELWELCPKVRDQNSSCRSSTSKSKKPILIDWERCYPFLRLICLHRVQFLFHSLFIGGIGKWILRMLFRWMKHKDNRKQYPGIIYDNVRLNTGSICLMLKNFVPGCSYSTLQRGIVWGSLYCAFCLVQETLT